MGDFDFASDLGGDNDSYLRYNSRSNSIDLDSYRLWLQLDSIRFHGW
jgi:hypothetical protein